MYEVDLPLFDGELLADSPLADYELHEISGLDGFHDVTTLVDPAENSTKLSAFEHEISQDVNLAAGQADQSGLLSPFGEGWLDSKMDLLELMCYPALAGEGRNNNSINLENETSSPLLEPSAHAVKLLEEAAEQAAEMLNPTKSQRDVADNSLADGIDLLDILYDSMADPSRDVLDNSVLSPMSPEDIESILSSAPTSPHNQDSFLTSLTGSDFAVSDISISSDDNVTSISVPEGVFVQSDLDRLLLSVEANNGLEQVEHQPDAFSPTGSLSRAKPYERKQKRDRTSKAPPLTKEEKILDRKLRKKQQNKDAATRYRQKKREESEAVGTELNELENRNTELKTSVAQMTGEIHYLKNLLAEVYQARGLKLKSTK